MSTASTQFEDERQLEFMMRKRHRQAALDAQIEMARAARKDATLTSRPWLLRTVSRLHAALRSPRAAQAPVSPSIAPRSAPAGE